MQLPFFSSKPKAPKTPYFGLLAEYADGQSLVSAIKTAKAHGYENLEAYTPIPMHEVGHALEFKSELPKLVFAGGLLGMVTGFGMQYYAAAVHYPVNIGGRPLNSWPSFIIITFEMTILFAALTAVLGMLALNGLPRPHHPVFDIPEFEQASNNRFFLLIMAKDPRFEREHAERLLSESQPLSLSEVPNP